MKFDAKAQVTQELKFKPLAELNDGISLGKLLSVEVHNSDADKNTGTGEYGGLSIPRIVWRFQQNKADSGDPDRFHNHVERVINSKMRDGTDIAPDTLNSLYESLWFRIKHMYDALGGQPISQKDLDKLVPDETAEPADRIEQFRKLFEFFADKFNTGKNDKMLAKGEVLAMKVIANYGDRKFYTFPTFVGQGFLEIAKFDKQGRLNTTLEIKPSESIVLGAGAKATSPSDGGGADELPDHIKEMLAKQQG